MKRKVINDVDNVASLGQQSTLPLMNRILKTHNLPLAEAKTFEWMRNLRCLSFREVLDSEQADTHQHSRKDVFVFEEVLVSLFGAEMKGFVVISYPWRASRWESAAFGTYKVCRLNGTRVPIRVRDIMITRISRYLRAHGLKGFWIDRVCINQKVKSEKSCAMQSMDLLYRLSPRSIGMLSVCVNQQWQVDTLQALIESALVKQSIGNVICLVPHLRISMVWKMIRYFLRLVSDPWWQRCWIYQEEYCASHRMQLLIPCASHLERNVSIFGKTSNELEIGAVQFRQELTKFVLACTRDHRLNSKQRSFLQRRLLRKTERYQTTFEHGYFRNFTLSSIIMTDVQSRTLSRPEDMLPIVANCCNYTLRLDPEVVKTRKVSLSLALLTQALLNGEILFNKRGFRPRLAGRFSQYFQRQILTQVSSPLGQVNLTFLKHTRFPQVEMFREGIGTSGHLWRIADSLDLARHKLSRYSDLPDQNQPYSSRDRALLVQLATLTRPGDQVLSACIERFARDLNQELLRGRRLRIRYKYMLAMAREVGLAIEEGRALYIGKIDGSACCRAVFVADSKTGAAPTTLFTAWHETGQLLQDWREPIPKYVSLEVNVEGISRKHKQQRLRIQKWTNGLCFLDGSAEERFIFPWPDAFL